MQARPRPLALPGWPTGPATRRVLVGATGRDGYPRLLRIFAGHLSETAQVTDAGRLTCAGAAGEPKLAPLRRASVRLSLTVAVTLAGWSCADPRCLLDRFGPGEFRCPGVRGAGAPGGPAAGVNPWVGIGVNPDSGPWADAPDGCRAARWRHEHQHVRDQRNPGPDGRPPDP